MNALAVLMLSVMVMAFGSTSAAPAEALLIVPGHRIGHTLLGSDGVRTLAALPKPARGDAGMSQRYYVWLSPAPRGVQNTLFIHATDNGVLYVKPLNGVTVDTIRVTSPRFSTASGLHTGSTLRQIRQQFPRLRFTNAAHTLCDDTARGIAFEFARRPGANSRAVAITVHTPGQSATATAQQVNELLKTS